MVSAWATRQRLVPGQEATGAKSNGISAISLLLERLHLTGALVSIDAAGTQTKIARCIAARGAGYLLALKDTQKALPPWSPCSSIRPGSAVQPMSPLMPTMAGSKFAATGSAPQSIGCNRTVTRPVNRAFPA